jgi:hypothetical protein
MMLEYEAQFFIFFDMLCTKLPKKLRSRSSSLALLLEFSFYVRYQNYWIEESLLDCGEPHYHHYYPEEMVGAFGSDGPATMGFLGKAHQIHAAVNNRQEEHQSIVLKTSGIVADYTLSI